MCLSELLSSGQKIFISASRTYFWNAPHTTRETDNYGKTGKEHLIKKNARKSPTNTKKQTNICQWAIVTYNSLPGKTDNF